MRNRLAFRRSVIIVVCAAGLAAATPAIAAGNGLITADFFKPYVDNFNLNDNEAVINWIPNSGAYNWMASNVPRFECPDKQLEKTYYFRWWTYRKNIQKTQSSPDRFIIHEVAGLDRAVNCAAGHHLYEGRWIRDPQYLDTYTQFWFGGGGEAGGVSKLYSNWLTDAAYARYMVNGNKSLVTGLLSNMVTNHAAWAADGNSGPYPANRKLSSGLYWQVDMFDGTEFSAGGSGARPLLNSYIYGNALALSRIAALAGNTTLANQYQAEAAQMRSVVQSQLWDPNGQFFKVKRDAPTEDPFYGNSWKEPCAQGQLVQTRELFGYAPWYFNLPENGQGYEQAWSQLSDTQGFKGQYGLTTCERRSPYYYEVPAGVETCMWNGSVWPYATSQTLTALANVLNNYQQTVIGKQQYFDALQTYSRSQQRTLPGGTVVPWIDESLRASDGTWITTNNDWGKDYNHSTFCDLIISGLVGLRPRADDIIEVNPLVPSGAWSYFCLDDVWYHGENLTIFWDQTGTKYGHGAGLHIWADGVEIGQSPTLTRIEVTLAPEPGAGALLAAGVVVLLAVFRRRVLVGIGRWLPGCRRSAAAARN